MQHIQTQKVLLVSPFAGQVRAKTKPASMRMPLEEDLEAVVEEGAEEEGVEQQPDLAAAAAAVGFEPVDAEKASFFLLILRVLPPRRRSQRFGGPSQC